MFPYFGMSESLFQAENLTTPGVDRMALYLDWLELANGVADDEPPDPEAPAPPCLPRLGVLRFRIM